MKSDSLTIEIADTEKLPAEPLVSVYMLTYNHEKYVARAIEGVIAQQCNFPIELIIGEDCSSDRTGEIVRDYQSRYPELIRVLTSEHNVGMHPNCDRCERACRGIYVAMCEGDDYWHHPKKLTMQVSQLAENPSATLVHTDFDRRIGNFLLRDFHRTTNTSYLAHGDALIDLLHMNTVYTVTAMYRRTILSNFANTDIVSDDWPMADYPRTLYAAMCGQIIYLPISTATYRKVSGSATNQPRSNSISFASAMLSCKNKFMALADVSDENKIHILKTSHTALLRLSLLANNKQRYYEEFTWLANHDENKNKLPHLLYRILLSNIFLLRIYRTLRMSRARIATWIRLKKVDEVDS